MTAKPGRSEISSSGSAPPHSPMALFENLAGCCAVTYAESRMYDWLLREYWRNVRPPFTSLLPDAGGVLSARFIAGSQLLVEWTGNPHQPERRLVLAAHTDCEGYVICKSRQDGSDVIFGGFSPTDQSDFRDVETWRIGAHVSIMAGLDQEDECRCENLIGIIETVGHQIDGVAAPRLGLVTIRTRIDDRDIRERILSATARIPGSVTAVHAFPQTGHRHANIKENGDIFAYGVDNAAGVAVATSLLTEMVVTGARTNISVLYTTGEEAGFVGLVDAIADDALKFGSQIGEWTWVVVDSSDQSKSSLKRLDKWISEALMSESSRRPAVAGEESNGGRCPMKCASIRLGDVISYYEPSTTRLLYQGALQARREYLLAVERGMAQKDEWIWIDSNWLGACGVFAGGICEAYVLQCMDELISEYSHQRKVISQPIKFGSVAIPLLNYRNQSEGGVNLDGDMITPTVPQPERAHVGGINSALAILREACKLHADYYDVKNDHPEIAGFRHRWSSKDANRDQIAARSKVVKDLMNYQRLATMNGALRSVKSWVSAKGNALAENVGKS